MVERESVTDALRAHDREARRVDEAEVLVAVLTQQPERPRFGLVLDEDPFDPPRLLEVAQVFAAPTPSTATRRERAMRARGRSAVQSEAPSRSESAR